MFPNFRLSEHALLGLREARDGVHPTSIPPRIAGRGTFSADPRVRDSQYALVRMVSIVESYIDSMALAIVEARVDSGVATQALLLADWEVSSTSSWDKRSSSFFKHLGVRLSDCAGHPELKAAIEIRNSIAHALGALTARQRSDSRLAIQLALIGATVGGGAIHLGANTLRLTCDACVALVCDVDARVPLT